MLCPTTVRCGLRGLVVPAQSRGFSIVRRRQEEGAEALITILDMQTAQAVIRTGFWLGVE